METNASDGGRQRSSAAVRVFDRVCRNPRTGEVVIVQRPNLPLILYLVAAVVRVVAEPDGVAGVVVSAGATAALAWWSVEEVVRGESLFRRGLGTAVLTGMVAQRLFADAS